MSNREREAYDRGRAEHLDGEDFARNPYEVEDQRRAWTDGWMDAYKGRADRYELAEAVADQPAVDGASVPAPREQYVPPESIDGVRLLNPASAPARSKPWGCDGCKLFQYAPCFTKEDRVRYRATLDPDRRERKNRSYQMDGIGPETARIMVVMDSPTADEDGSGKTASGGGARIMMRNARDAGLHPDRWFWTYAVRCRGPEAPNFRTASYCTKFLSGDIERVRPRVIITAGGLPTKLMLGKADASVLQYNCVPQEVTVAGHRCFVFPMWSPGYVRANDYLSGEYAESFCKLAAFLRGETKVAEDMSLYELVESVDDAIALCRSLMGRPSLAVDLETSGLSPYVKGARVSVISLAPTTKKGYAVPYNHDDVPWSDADRRRFLDEGYIPLLQQPEVGLDWHNGKFDYKWHYHCLGFMPRDLTNDTMLMHYASDENEEHGLKPLSLRYTDMGDYDQELDQYLGSHFPKDAPRYDLTPWKLVGKYAGMDTVACRKLKKVVAASIAAQDECVHALAYRVLPAYSSALTRMEHVGCHIDMESARAALPVLETEAKRSYDAIMAEPVVRRFCRAREEAERNKRKHPEKLPPVDEKRYFEFSLDSPKQLSELLFDKAYYGHEVLAFTEKGAPATDKEAMNALAEVGSPIAKRIIEFRLDDKLVSTYVRPTIETCDAQAEPFIHPSFLVHGTKTGRISCKAPNLQNIPNKGAGYIKRMFDSRYGDGGCLIQSDYCLAPETKVLTADLRWVPVGDVAVGQELIGFDEHIDGRRAKARGSFVIRSRRIRRPCYRVTLSNGKVIIASAEHKWVGFRRSDRTSAGAPVRYWQETSDLAPGDRLAHYCDTWDAPSSMSDGYVAGLLDGEGWVGTEVGFGQNPGVVLDAYVGQLRADGFDVRIDPPRGKCSTARVTVVGAPFGSMRLLGKYRPVRLMAKSRRLWEGRSLWGRYTRKVHVVSSEYVGEQEVVALATSTKTLIAEGFLSHNSQVELRILACVSNDQGMIDAFCRAEDLHKLTALMIFDLTSEAYDALDSKEQKRIRTIAKRVNFGIPYGVGGPGISSMLAGEGIDIDADTCGGYIEKFFEQKPKVKRWIDRVMESTSDEAVSRSLFGRRRRLEQVRSRVHNVVARAHRQAVNHPIQSSGADLTLTSLALMDYEIERHRGTPEHLLYPTIDHMPFDRASGWDGVHLILTVHDSIIFDCRRDMASSVFEMCSRVMPNIVDLAPIVWGRGVSENIGCLRKVPMTADIEIGPNYRDAVKADKIVDIARSMFVADRRRAFFDADHKGKWDKDMDKKAEAEFAAKAAGST